MGHPANGSLASLNISTDQFNAANVQLCNYTHDDLARLGKVDCTNGNTKVWGQSFAYDGFGNIVNFQSGACTFSDPTSTVTALFQEHGHTNNKVDNTTESKWMVPTDASGNPYVSVTVTYPFRTISNFPGFPNPITITRTIQMRVAPTVPANS